LTWREWFTIPHFRSTALNFQKHSPESSTWGLNCPPPKCHPGSTTFPYKGNNAETLHLMNYTLTSTRTTVTCSVHSHPHAEGYDTARSVQSQAWWAVAAHGLFLAQQCATPIVAVHWDEAGGSTDAQVVIRVMYPVIPLAVSPMSLDAGKGHKNRLLFGVFRARRVVES
jgi:hypothetical protein